MNRGGGERYVDSPLLWLPADELLFFLRYYFSIKCRGPNDLDAAWELVVCTAYNACRSIQIFLVFFFFPDRNLENDRHRLYYVLPYKGLAIAGWDADGYFILNGRECEPWASFYVSRKKKFYKPRICRARDGCIVCLSYIFSGSWFASSPFFLLNNRAKREREKYKGHQYQSTDHVLRTLNKSPTRISVFKTVWGLPEVREKVVKNWISPSALKK